MSNDITALMATMKAAALKAKSEANEWGYDTDAFHDEATPDAVIELVEALEQAQQYAKERDEENQGLMLTVGRLRVEREALESRTVALSGTDLSWEQQQYHEEVIEILRAAGIQVIEGGA